MKRTKCIVSSVISALLCFTNLQMTVTAEEEAGSGLTEEVIAEQYSDEEAVPAKPSDESSKALDEVNNDSADSETEEAVPEDEETAEEVPSFQSSGGGWEYYHENGTVIITGYIGADTDVVVPEEIDGLPVVRISGYIFKENKNITSVTIPDCVEGDSLSGQLFMNCASLETVVLPADTTTIRSNMFYGCTSLKRISGPEHVIF